MRVSNRCILRLLERAHTRIGEKVVSVVDRQAVTRQYGGPYVRACRELFSDYLMFPLRAPSRGPKIPSVVWIFGSAQQTEAVRAAANVALLAESLRSTGGDFPNAGADGDERGRGGGAHTQEIY